MKIILNADDFGANQIVNQEIARCIHKEEISSTTIIAGGNEFEQAILLAKQYPNISYGVHLAIDEYQSLTKSQILRDYGITDDKGMFIKEGIEQIEMFDEKLKRAISDEWNAQIWRVKSEGIKVSHIDSHHHYHTIPALRKVIESTMVDNGIYHIRQNAYRSYKIKIKERKRKSINTQTKIPGAILNKSLVRKLECYVCNYVWNRRMNNKFSTTDFFCSLQYFYDNFSLLESSGYHTIEVMTHPGHAAYFFEEELRHKIVDDRGIKFDVITYNDLK